MTSAMGRRRAAPLFAVGAAALLLAACATPRPAAVALPAPPPEAAAGVAELRVDESAMLPLLGYLQLVPQFSAAELARERRVLAAIPQTPSTQLRQAMLLAQTRTAGDLARATALIDKLQKSGDAAAFSLRPLLAVLASHYQERQRLLAQNDRLQQQLTDSLRRGGELQQQLDALADIEATLRVRPASGAAPAAGAP